MSVISTARQLNALAIEAFTDLLKKWGSGGAERRRQHRCRPRDGSPSIAFFDATKKVRLMASAGVSGPSVSLLDLRYFRLGAAAVPPAF
jgi:hypothetical protein